MKIIKKLFAFALGFFGVTFAIYWFNIDMKAIKKLYFAAAYKLSASFFFS